MERVQRTSQGVIAARQTIGIAVLALAVGILGLWLVTRRAHRHRVAAAITRISELEGLITYDWEVDSKGRFLSEPKEPERTVMRGILDRDCECNRAWAVTFFWEGYVTDADLVCLQEFPNLRKVALADSLVTDEGLEYLSRFRDLEILSLRGTAVTDEGVMHLLTLRKLRYLDIERTKITQRGLARLRTLPSLSKIRVDDNLRAGAPDDLPE